MPSLLTEILQNSAARHSRHSDASHLCPRQVLGARIGLAGIAALNLDLPHTPVSMSFQQDKRLLVILESDGCFADGVESATGCSIGHRTLRIEDYGKIAATFIDTKTEQAIRISPQHDIRERAFAFATAESRHYFAQLAAYQSIPTEALLTTVEVRLTTSVRQLISRPGIRVQCEQCGEEIINEREVTVNGHRFCHTCSWGGYYSPIKDVDPVKHMINNNWIQPFDRHLRVALTWINDLTKKRLAFLGRDNRAGHRPTS